MQTNERKLWDFTIRTTGTYTQGVTPTKRAAQTKLVKMILVPGKPREKQASGE